ncbi:MAG TPA: SMP-30/gluconolactonase/LRE family protein [Blastocatellia bacterium]|nr:SMP-30/gluconolactonase/LRE family protein [Blastocatellia bacterium]
MRKLIGFILGGALCCALFPQLFKPAPVQAADPPELRRVKPDKITAGTPTYTIRLEGRNFLAGAKVVLDGTALPSRVNANNRVLLAEIDASVAANPGTHTVSVLGADGATSASLTFEVVNADPNLKMQLNGNSVEEDQPADLITDVFGQGFTAKTTALIWGDESPKTTFNSERAIEIQLPAAFMEDPALVPVMVRNKGGELSNVDIFFVVPNPPSVSEIDPFETTVGNEDLPLVVFGGNFNDTAVIVVNGQRLETTHPKSGRLEATVPAAFRAAPAQLIVRVEQDGIQSHDQTLTVAPTEDPFIFTVAPILIREGEKKEGVDLVGANFRGEGLKATVDGKEATISAQSRRQVTVVVRVDELALGTHEVKLTTADGKDSNVATFDVVPDVMVDTLAGQNLDGFISGCLSADLARLRRPSRIGIDSTGLLYFTDSQNHVIRSLNVAANEICTVIGTGAFGYNDSSNPRGFQPTFSNPLGLAIAGDGTMYVTENGNNVIRRIRKTPSGLTVDTFAGAREELTDKSTQNKLNSTLFGIEGFHGGDGLTAQFRQPDDIVIAPDGTFYVSDTGNHSIRRIRIAGSDVTVDTIAGNGTPGFVDGEGVKARFRVPTGLALSADAKTLYVADLNNHRIRTVDLTTFKVVTLSGSGEIGSHDGPPGEATFNHPIGLARDTDGTLYVTEVASALIRRVDTAGNATTLAGGSRTKFRDGTGLLATFKSPRGITIDRTARMLYVADYENFRIRAIDLP